MAAQNLPLLRGFGAFVVAGVELTPDTPAGAPYNTAAGTVDFTARSTAQQDTLYAANHATNPQQDSGTTVAFVYSDYS